MKSSFNLVTRVLGRVGPTSQGQCQLCLYWKYGLERWQELLATRYRQEVIDRQFLGWPGSTRRHWAEGEARSQGWGWRWIDYGSS